ncbi:MAG: bifunctional 5,10-methylenetetrahydrofolate dehydrogenase/5,10-methenyltetrahydrofolate cyclohydrolase [bacterium]
MSEIIDGKKLAEKIKDKIASEIFALKGPRPNLAIILVGERPDSEMYVSLKEKQAKQVGIDTHLYRCPENIGERELLEIIEHLNNDKLIDAILIQLPLPDKIDADTIIMAVDPEKDVDGFQPDNLEKLFKARDFSDLMMPPVFAAVLEMLASVDYEIENKQALVISNSDVFGKSLAHVLKCRGAIVESAKADDKNLAEKSARADILITAVGKSGFIKQGMIKQGAAIIDIGISKKGDKITGDVDFEDVKERASYITPVPGGVGPMTIAMAFKNTLEIFKKKRKI